jgi:hypothetical protein
MLYVGCSNCRSVGPFYCGGQFGPHPPLPAEPSPMGPCCGFCGVMAPVFTCMRCGMVQGMYMPGMAPPPAPFPGLSPLVAPVYQAPASAPPHQIESGLRTTAQTFVREIAKGFAGQLGQDAANAMAGW